ncbi:MAG: CHAT domain-containing protein [Saprospiraceae bacterium]|nr:CHAT domain-containing protein [Saprospiraceae bacterium]
MNTRRILSTNCWSWYLGLHVFVFSQCTDPNFNYKEISDDSCQKKLKEYNLKLNEISDTVLVTILDTISSMDCIETLDSVYLMLANRFHSKGNNYLSGNLTWALKFHRVSLKLRKLYYGDTLHVDVLRSWSNMGTAYMYDGNYYQALKYFDSVNINDNRFEVFPQIYNRSKASECFRIIGDYRQSIFQFEKALNTVFNCIRSHDCLSSENWKKTSWVVQDLIANGCLTYQASREYHKGLEIGSLGLDITKSHNSGVDSIKSLARIKMIMGNLWLDSANCVSSKNSSLQAYRNSLDFYDLAWRDFNKIQDTASMITAVRNKGATLFYLRQYDKAITTLKQGIYLNQIFRKNKKNEDAIALYINLGSNLIQAGAKSEGLENYKYAASLVTGQNLEIGQIPNLESFGDSYDLGLYLLGSLGRAHLLLADSSRSHGHYSQMAYDSLARLMNLIRAGYISDQAKLALAAKSRIWIPDAVWDMTKLFFKTGNEFFKKQAFHFAEHAKAFLLLEAARLQNSKQLLPDDLYRLELELNQIQLEDNENILKGEIIQGKQRRFIERLKSEAHAYYALKYQGVTEDPARDMIKLLDSDQSMIKYFIHDSALIIFAIQKDAFFLDTVQILKSHLYSKVSGFRKNINPVNELGLISEEYEKEFCSESKELYSLLIGKIRNKIQLNKRLVIIPDGVLSNLSFDALIITRDSVSEKVIDHVKAQNFLIQHFDISYSFSASMLELMNAPTNLNRFSKSFALIAPEFQKTSEYLSHMKYQKEEINEIYRAVPASTMLKSSTKQDFLNAKEQFRFLHISAHGFEASDPNESFISFDQKSDTPDSNQFLFLKELYHIPMHQELISLTACETALGTLHEGEGNLSLARGFTYAGVKALITTLWKIQTQGASKIIPGFYKKFFNEGKPKDVALAESKREYLNAGKAVYPDEWAGLILIGNTQAYSPANDGPNYLLMVLVSILILMLGIWISKYKFQNRKL